MKPLKKHKKIRFAAGPTGYKSIQDLEIPLPGTGTLQRRRQRVTFEPGVLDEVFNFLELKATLDEMAITPSVELHMGLGK